MTRTLIWFSAIIMLLLAGCLLRHEDAARTYPEALDLERVSLDELRYTVAAPDSYNVIVYVTNVWECPPNMDCLVADGFSISEERGPESPEDVLALWAERPSQLLIGEQYLMSIRVQDGTRDEQGNVQRQYRLLGYTWLDK